MHIAFKNKSPDIRRLYEMKNVLYDQEWAKTAPNLELYYMYRGVDKKDGLRYDITIIPAKMLGKEFVKTAGHEHIGNFGEVYIVLEGKAIYLMQKTLHQSKLGAGQRKEKKKRIIIDDVFAIKAKKGEVAIIPPGYGHVTINPSKKNLKMANWMAKKSKSDYQPIKKMAGACYFYTKQGWIKNKNYKKIPELRFKKPLKSIPRDLDFLRG